MSSTAALSPEYRAITASCGLLDRSERGKLSLTGRDAKSFLQGQVSNDVESLTPGTGCYAAFLTPKGKMLGDLRILDAGGALLLDTERVALQGLFNTIRRFSVGYDVQLLKRTLERGLLSLIGPEATSVAGVAELADAPEHQHLESEFSGITLRAIRTDTGVDLLCEAADTGHLSSVLQGAGALMVDESAVECLRVEHGRPRYGIDIDDTVIPQEAGLNERAVSFTKGCYVGQETVARLHYRGKPNRHLRGLRLSAPAATGDPVRLREREVGRLGSVVESPRFGWIALALIRREVPVGETVALGDENAAQVVDLPFG
jgi:folate-binding protein YgfZ